MVTTKLFQSRDALGLNATGRWLVDDEPEQSKRLDGFGEFGEVDGFADVGVGSVVVASQAIALLVGAGQHDDWYQASARLLT